jgi:CheY-like chemotaxis protein
MGLDGVRVLLIDDDYRNLFALTALLERGNAEVTVAESGAEALAVLARMPETQVILTDIMMPVMDGYATIRAIRQLDGFTDVPIIAVTSKVVPGERERCMDAGANDYVPKPVDTTELLTTLTPWLPRTRTMA